MKTILIIGASSGYGKGVKDFFTLKNYNVIEASRTGTHVLDVSNDLSVVDFFNKLKGTRIDIVFYSAGIAIGKQHIKDKNINDIESVFKVNTIGLINVLKHSYEFLLETKGSFFQIGSIAHELSYVGGADYCASKSASNTIMKTIRKEWLGSEIRTTSLEVGLGDTSFQFNRYKGNQQEANKHTNGVRQIKPFDLGEIVYFISQSPDYLNFDEIVLKPIDQASHGISINNATKQF